jgi:hypothetical protein
MVTRCSVARVLNCANDTSPGARILHCCRRKSSLLSERISDDWYSKCSSGTQRNKSILLLLPCIRITLKPKILTILQTYCIQCQRSFFAHFLNVCVRAHVRVVCLCARVCVCVCVCVYLCVYAWLCVYVYDNIYNVILAYVYLGWMMTKVYSRAFGVTFIVRWLATATTFLVYFITFSIIHANVTTTGCIIAVNITGNISVHAHVLVRSLRDTTITTHDICEISITIASLQTLCWSIPTGKLSIYDWLFKVLTSRLCVLTPSPTVYRHQKCFYLDPFESHLCWQQFDRDHWKYFSWFPCLRKKQSWWAFSPAFFLASASGNSDVRPRLPN